MARDLSDARPVDQPSIIDGLFTTEFWTTIGGLLANLLVVLIAIGYINREDADMLTSSIGSIVAAVQMLAVNGALIWKFVSSRTSLKTEQLRQQCARENLKLTLLMQSSSPQNQALAMRLLGEPVTAEAPSTACDPSTGCCQKNG